MRNKLKIAVLDFSTTLFQVWLMDTHPVGHPVECVKYHAYRFAGWLGRAL
ncbi:hypothetical protein [Brevundimonas phage AA]|uniref:Uncharacterized protein n=1 Tax=Brevundimonas phage AA TaxID=2880937 RepID=A0AAN0KEA4_9CAUD|nr:hypothetical protein [Brevundimonas phage BC]UCR90854.1 hypothetical protein [Brevundimonas phage AA]